ncbi:MAG: hypothetical protein EBY38_02130 [Flavobacteriaceae bacterium]|nr:hypothetical protein [Flavobacteriaceae bacterium]
MALWLVMGCSSDDANFDYLDTVQVPSNLSLLVTSTTDNSGNVIFTPSALSASKFILDYGDGSDPEEVVPGTNAVHAYTEGTFTAVLVAAYPETGTYQLRVVALSGGSQTIEGTEEVVIDNPILLPLDFEDPSLDYVFFDFAGAINTKIANPDPSGVNPSATVVEFFKESGALVYAGTAIPLGENIDFSQNAVLKMDVWSPIVGSTVKMKLENAANPNIAMEFDALTSVSGAWETLEFDFSSFDLTQEYAKIVVFFDFGNTGNDDTFYYDNIDFAN